MVLPPGPVSTMSPAEAALFDMVDIYGREYEDAATELALSPAQACVLGRLDEPRGMGALAEELGCDASNITQIVVRLEALGLVAREPNPQDRRARILTRTPLGDETNDRFATAFTFARTAVGRLSSDEQVQLTALLRKALGET